ncbi:MAG: hypothetical protein ACTSUR_01365 [Candidatus Heimdallarchaeaceae archaeon]
MSTTYKDFQFIYYEPFYSDPQESYHQFSEVYNHFKEKGEESVNFRVLSYFYEGMLYLINGDAYYFQEDYNQALQNYESANKLIVRSRASRGVEGDQIFEEMMKWANYAEAMKKLVSGKLEKDLDRQIDIFISAKPDFIEFLNARKKEENKIDEIIALARISYLEYLYLRSLAEKKADDTRSYKRYLLRARTELFKANFIYRILDKELDDIQNKIDEITKQHIVARAETFWDNGTKHNTISMFKKAQRFFAIASKYYSRASEICENFMEQRLYLALSKITLASRLESEANELYKRKDNPEKASARFLKAVETVDLALGLLSSIKSESLIKNMRAQRSFYEALALETEGIVFFDKEEFEQATERFEQAIKKLDETQLSASEGNLENLIEFVRTAKSEIEGYISMAKAIES